MPSLRLSMFFTYFIGVSFFPLFDPFTNWTWEDAYCSLENGVMLLRVISKGLIISLQQLEVRALDLDSSSRCLEIRVTPSHKSPK